MSARRRKAVASTLEAIAEEQEGPRPRETMLPVASLVEWDRNPRVNDAAVDKLVRVIQRFGFLDPLIVRRSDLRVIAGHTRLKSAKKLGLTEVPVILLDLSDDDARDLAVAHNRSAEESEWDPAMLAGLVADGLDLEDVGFEPSEIDELISSLTAEERPESAFDGREAQPRASSFTLHLWTADAGELEGLVSALQLPGETRADTVLRILRDVKGST